MSNPPPDAIIDVRDVHKRYEMGPRSLEVLRGVSLKIARRLPRPPRRVRRG